MTAPEPGPLVVPSRRAVALAFAGVVLLVATPWVPWLVYVVLAYDALLVAAVLGEGVALRRRAALRVERGAPRRFSLGEEHQIALSVDSYAPFAVELDLGDDPPNSFERRGPTAFSLRLPAYGRERRSYIVVPTRRGDHSFGAVLFRLRGPLGLAALTGRYPAVTRAKVYPSLKGLWRLELAARFLEKSSGFRSLRREGGGDEFEKLREYLPDDDFRHIDWKATARRHRPVTRVFEAERNQTVMICIDTGRAMAARSGELTKLDHAVNAALLVAYAALRFDDQVGLLLFADEVQAYVPPRKGAAQLRRITEALYGAEAALRFVDFREPLRFLRARIRRRALLVFFTDLLDEEHVRPLVQYGRRLAARHLPLVITLSDHEIAEAARRPPRSADEVYEQVVATEALHERQTLVRAFLAEGAQVVDAPPGRLNATAVNRYIELKRSRRI